MSNDENEVVAEHFHTFDNIPVCICVLETRGGFCAVGYSATKARRFDPEIGQAFARGNAMQTLRRKISEWERVA
jgi:hypothetical protein